MPSKYDPEYWAKYYAANRDRLNRNRRKRYQSDVEYRERCKDKAIKWYANNRDRMNAYHREYRKNNRTIIKLSTEMGKTRKQVREMLAAEAARKGILPEQVGLTVL